jgi:superfamily II DNA or RNA helicase
MSVKVHLSSFSGDERKRMASDLIVKRKETQYCRNPPAIYPYTIDESGYGIFPFAYMRKTFSGKGIKNVFSEKRRPFEFLGTLRPEQLKVQEECIEHLNTLGSSILSMYPGFGKTALAIALAARIGLPTLVVVNRIVLLNQWRDSIVRFCPSVSISTSYERPGDAQIVVVNAINVEKMTNLSRYGFLVVDECHMIVTETLSKCLIVVHPRYLLGLSATPYRPDGMDMLIDLHFGTNKIIRKLSRKHIVYIVDTGFVPEMKVGRSGKPEWNSVIDSQSKSEIRVDIIRRIVEKFKSRKFLILCKRIEQAKLIETVLVNETPTTLFGDSQTYNKESRILIATVQKAGVGFDDSSIDALILASDIQEYFVQYLGRCMRTPEVVPLVFDLVDRNVILKRHFSERKKVYLESGAEIKRLVF